MTKNKKTGLSENWSIDKSSIENGPVKYDKNGFPDKATPAQVGEMARKLEEMRQMTGSDGRYDKTKPKKKVMAPIEIPPIISVPRYEDYKKRRSPNTFEEGMGEYSGDPEIMEGLSRGFTQNKLREGKILKQIDQQMTNERKNNPTTNTRGEHD